MAAMSFSQLEKIIQEKSLYRILIAEYFDKDILGIVGTGFWMTKEIFQIEIYVRKQMFASLCKTYATLVGDKFNLLVTADERKETAGWSFTLVGDEVWSFKVFVYSEHSEEILNNELVKKMIHC